MASTFTPNIDLELPQLGDYVNDWHVPLNANLTAIDTAIGGLVSVALSGSNVTLTAAQFSAAIIEFTGTLTANITVTIPSGAGGKKYIYDQTTRGGHTITLVGSSSGSIPVMSHAVMPVLSIGGVPMIDPGWTPPGSLLPYATQYSWPPGYLFCDGSAISRTTYAALFAAIGTLWGSGDGSTTFNLPDSRGRTFAGQDAGSGRLNGWVSGTVGGESAHSLVTGELPAHNHPASDSGHSHGAGDGGHNHGVSESDHTHTDNISGSVAAAVGGAFTAAVYGSGAQTGGATSNISINTGYGNIWVGTSNANISVGNTGGGGAHNNVQPTFCGQWFIKF